MSRAAQLIKGEATGTVWLLQGWKTGQQRPVCMHTSGVMLARVRASARRPMVDWKQQYL